MGTHSEKDHLPDQEIIELTEVVEEPSQPPSVGSSTLGDQENPYQSENGHPGGAPSRSQNSGHKSVEDDFNFTALLQDSQDGDTLNRWTERPATSSKKDEQSSVQDFDDLDDLFDELDLDLAPDHAPQPGQEGLPQIKSQELIKDLRSRLEDMDSRISELENLHSLESRIQDLEAGVKSKQSWKEIEARIMNRLEDLVQEKIAELKESLTLELSSKNDQTALPSKEEVDNLAQKVDEISSYALGPETIRALKNELWNELSQRIEDVVPQAAARIIREEIQSLEEDEPDISQERANR
jgi:hypothetical protein